MNNTFVPDDEPENQNNTEDQKPSDSPKLSSKPVFEYSDESEFDNLRQVMANSNSNPASSVDSEIENSTFIEDIQPQPNFSNNQPSSPFSGFIFEQETDVNSSQSLNSVEDNRSESPDKVPAVEWDNASGNLFVADDIATRMDELHSSSEENNPSQIKVTPPFVVEEDYEFGGKNLSIVEQVRRGIAPAETIELLITEALSEDEVIKLARELGIDWTLIPGDSRTDKTQFLVDYFKNKEFTDNRGAFIDSLNPQFENIRTEEDWRESDSRLQALQETLNLPDTVSDKKKSRNFFSQLIDDLDQSHLLVRGLTIGLSIVALTLAILVAYLYINFYKPATAQLSVDPTKLIPFPVSLQFPGGWTFNLATGNLNDGNWNPTSPEWLQGSEICRIVSLPWTKQLEAIIQTFTTEDDIRLVMNNNDILTYKVEAIKTIKSSELEQLANLKNPSLVIVLTQKDSDVRQIVFAKLTSQSGNQIGGGSIVPQASATP